MKLVLYSKLDTEMNLEIQEKLSSCLLAMVENNDPCVGVIEYKTDAEVRYYRKNVAFYNKLGISRILRFDLDEKYNEQLREKLYACDIIHLPGGNTYNFLAMLKKRNMLEELHDFGIRGGVIVGVSAGAHIISSTIGIAQFGDENEVGLEDLIGLDLVKFEIKPHWNKDERKLSELLKYSIINNTTIFTVNDGEGIIIQDDSIKLFGNIGIIENGVYNGM